MTSDQRKRDLAQIHIAKQQLGMEEDVYRGLLQTIGRVDSSAKLSAEGRQRLLAHFRACGWKPSAPRSNGASSPRKAAEKRPTPAPENVKLVRRIRAQLISLGRLPNTYADGIAKQAFGIDFYEWCTSEQLWELTNMLTAEQKRKGADTGPAMRVVKPVAHSLPRSTKVGAG